MADGEVVSMDSELWQQRFTEHLRSYRRSEQTILSYLVTVRHFLSFLEQRGLSGPGELGKADVEAYQVSLEHTVTSKGKPLALTSKNNKVSVVRAFIKFLRRTNVLMTDPTRDIVCPRPPKTILPELPTEEHIERLLETPDVSTPLGLRDRAILELFYSSALRNAELRLLQVGDVDFSRLQVRVYRGKGGRGRVVPVGEVAAAWVERYLSEARAQLLQSKEHGFLFISFRGRPFKCNRLGEVVVRNAEEAGLPMRVTPHVLRHCCATHMLRNNVRLRHLQEFLGHASPSSTQIYTRVEISDLKQAHKSCHPREHLQ
ncbi:MAG: tyrosine-type recombinase/integrase [Vulcanimicrobiota bacterium]